jgi:cytochrome P450
VTDTTTVDPANLLLEVLLTPEGKQDPYARYNAIREATPAFPLQMGPVSAVVVSRYDDCQSILRDQRFGKGEGPFEPWLDYGMTEEEWAERFPNFQRRTRSMLMLDPPDHTRLRGLVAKAFTPKTVEDLRPSIARLTDDIIGRFDGEHDVMAELALTLPMTVIGEMLGVPEPMRTELAPFVRRAVATLEFAVPLEVMEDAAAAGQEIADRFDDLIEERRKAPTDDLLSALIHVEEQGDQLDHDELIATVILLFAAGFETTTNLIGNGLLALLEHPDQLQRVRDDRSLLKPCVEELLRWDSPVQIDGRQVLQEAEVHGQVLQPGEMVITLLGAANRDPRKWDDPDVLDVARKGPQPMSFAAGIHYCLGAPLARAEGQVVLERILDTFRSLEPAWDERPRYRNSIVLHGLETLPVRFTR